MELITSPSMNVQHFIHEQCSACFIILQFCLFTYLNSAPSARRASGTDLPFEFIEPGLEKPSEHVRGKEQGKRNEKLKSNKLKIKGPQADGRSRSRFGIQECGARDLKSWEPRARADAWKNDLNRCRFLHLLFSYQSQ